MKGAHFELQGQGKLGQLGLTCKFVVEEVDLILMDIIFPIGTVDQTVASPRLAILSTVV